MTKPHFKFFLSIILDYVSHFLKQDLFNGSCGNI